MNIGEFKARIEHVVVLMMENRSFDHALGGLRLQGWNVDGVDPSRSNPDSSGSPQTVEHLTGAWAEQFKKDPPHDSRRVEMQIWSQGRDKPKDMNGFVRAFENLHGDGPDAGNVMRYLTDENLWMTWFLAKEFTICDRWFCSVPTSTLPNRLYSLCGHAAGHEETPVIFAVKSLSIFEALRPSDWRVYHGAVPMAFYFTAIAHDQDDAYIEAHFHPLKDFAAEVDTLPAVTWIEPVYGFPLSLGGQNDDHPSAPVGRGQRLIRTIYDALVKSKIWESTLLIINYDEHGGFYDHVAPDDLAPELLLPRTDSRADRFTTYGPRVPALLVSPYVKKGQTEGVAKQRLEHCSVIRLICDWKDLTIGGFPPRVQRAPRIEEVLSTEKRTTGNLPPTPGVPVSAAELAFDAPVHAAPAPLDPFQASLKAVADDFAARRPALAAKVLP